MCPFVLALLSSALHLLDGRPVVLVTLITRESRERSGYRRREEDAAAPIGTRRHPERKPSPLSEPQFPLVLNGTDGACTVSLLSL